MSLLNKNKQSWWIEIRRNLFFDCWEIFFVSKNGKNLKLESSWKYKCNAIKTAKSLGLSNGIKVVFHDF